MLEPTLEEAKRRAGEGSSIPVWLELLADLETPVSAYMKLGGGRGSFLLESIDGGERLGRYSFIGLAPSGEVTFRDGEALLSGDVGDVTIVCPDPLELIDHLLTRERIVNVEGLPRFHGGAVGFLSYDVVRAFEDIPAPGHPGLGLPLGVLGWYRTVLAFDHLKRTIKIITLVPTGGDLEESYERANLDLRGIAARLECQLDSRDHSTRAEHSAPVSTSPDPLDPASSGGTALAPTEAALRSITSKDQFEQAVLRVKDYISAGDAIQVVLSQRLAVPTNASPLALYRALRSVNPSPYMYFLDYGNFQIVGASPEMLVRVEGSRVAVHPIAGTRRRGKSQEEDDRLALELLSDEKERAEHNMLVDLGRNDVGRVSEPGSVVVKQMMEIERYSHVMHLVSHVEGRLRKELRPVDALRAGFPAGTVSGAPKVRAMEIIAELESEARGPYAGAVGYFGFDGAVDTAIAIRTAVLMDGVAHVQVGAGIVADSDPAREYEETMNKATAMLRAIKSAESIEVVRRSMPR